MRELPLEALKSIISIAASHSRRCLFLSRDSGHSIRRERVVPKKVGSFTTQLLPKLKRLVRFFQGGRQWIQVFEFGDVSSEVTVFSDSDWAGDIETRKSSSVAVALVGRHLSKAYTRKQKIIARSGAEAELYAAALGASEAKGIQSMMRDFGFAVKPVLIFDAHSSSTWNLQNETHRRGALVVAG